MPADTEENSCAFLHQDPAEKSTEARKKSEKKRRLPDNMTICYRIADKLYLNLTNRCNNNCTFCLRQGKRGIAGYNLRLPEDPTAEMVNRSLDSLSLRDYSELVYCGFGEPTLALGVLLQSARHVREKSKIPI